MASRNGVAGFATGFDESQRAIVEHLQAHAPLVYQAVMKAAQRHEIGKLRLATVRPMMNVVSVDEARVRATGEAAPSIA